MPRKKVVQEGMEGERIEKDVYTDIGGVDGPNELISEEDQLRNQQDDTAALPAAFPNEEYEGSGVLPGAIPAADDALDFDDTSHLDTEGEPGTPAPQRAPSPHDPDWTPQPDTPSADANIPAKPPAGGVQAGDGEESEEPKFDSAILAAADLTEAQAKEQFKTPDALENAVRMRDERLVNLGQQESRRQQIEQGFPAPPPQPQQPPAPTWPATQWQQQPPTSQPPPQSQPPADASSGQPAQFQMPKLPDGANWDESTVKLVNALNQHYTQQFAVQADQMAQQREAVLALMQQQDEAVRQNYVREFDNFVDGLTDDWKPLLGEGSGHALSQEGLAFQNRVHLDSIAADLQRGRTSQGQPELGTHELLSRALRIAFPNQQESAVRRQVVQQVAQRDSMKTHRPTQRRSAAAVDPTRKAVATVNDFFKSRGWSVDDDIDDYGDDI